MKRIQVLGTGCGKCEKLVDHSRAAVNQSDVVAIIEEIAEAGRILTFGVATTPALVIDGEVKAIGRVPDVDEISRWLAPNDGQLSSGKSTAPSRLSAGVVAVK